MNSRDHTPLVLVKQHWHHLALLTFSILVAAFSFVQNNLSKNDRDRQNQLYQAQAQTNLDSANALNLLNQFYPRFKAYSEGGVIGNARRLQHLEMLRALGNNIGVPSVTFSIEESTYATMSNYYIWDDIVHLQYSIMRLDLILDHEGQFQQFMDGMLKYAEGVYSMQECAIQRSDDSKLSSDTGDLKAACELHWYTIRDITSGWSDDELAQQ